MLQVSYQVKCVCFTPNLQEKLACHAHSIVLSTKHPCEPMVRMENRELKGLGGSPVH